MLTIHYMQSAHIPIPDEMRGGTRNDIFTGTHQPKISGARGDEGREEGRTRDSSSDTPRRMDRGRTPRTERVSSARLCVQIKHDEIDEIDGMKCGEWRETGETYVRVNRPGMRR